MGGTASKIFWSMVQTWQKNEGLTKSELEQGQVNWANLQG